MRVYVLVQVSLASFIKEEEHEEDLQTESGHKQEKRLTKPDWAGTAGFLK